MEIPKASEIASLASLLAPGLIILGIRARFRGGSPKELKDNLVAYAVSSSAYYAAAYPVFHADGGIQLWPWFWQLLIYFIVPVLAGLGIVVLDQSEVFYWFSRKLRLRSTHHIPAAWDFAFSKLIKGTYVIVRLSDGTRYAGLMGKDSFASSATGERDLLIEEVWRISENGPWVPVEPRRAVLLCGKDIRWIEIFRRS